MNPRWRRAAPISAIGVIITGVVRVGLFHHAPPIPQAVAGPPKLYSSQSSSGGARPDTPQPNETNIFNWKGPAAGPALESTPTRHSATQMPVRSAPRPQSNQTGISSEAANAIGVPELAGRFPALAHQVFVSVPQSGSEPDYFAKLGNLLNGTPLPPGTTVPVTGEHLAQAQAKLDRGDLAGAAAEVQAISGPAAMIMHSWLSEAENRLTPVHPQPRRVNARVAQNTPSPRKWPNVMPSEIPSYARETTDPRAP